MIKKKGMANIPGQMVASIKVIGKTENSTDLENTLFQLVKKMITLVKSRLVTVFGLKTHEKSGFLYPKTLILTNNLIQLKSFSSRNRSMSF